MIFTKREIAFELFFCSLILSSCCEPIGSGVTTLFEHRECQSILLLSTYLDHDDVLSIHILTDGPLMESDSIIESQILNYHHRKLSDSGSAIDNIIYHTIVCTDIRITLSAPLEGIIEGDDLNDLFLLDPNGPGYIFTSNKELIGSISVYSSTVESVSLLKWLSLSPLMLHELYLKSKQPLKIPPGTTLQVTVALEGGKECSASVSL